MGDYKNDTERLIHIYDAYKKLKDSHSQSVRELYELEMDIVHAVRESMEDFDEWRTTKRKWKEVSRDLRVAAKRAEFYDEMGLADIFEAKALDALDKACVDFLYFCSKQWLARARAEVEEETK